MHQLDVFVLRAEVIRICGARGAIEHERTVVVELGEALDGRGTKAQGLRPIRLERPCGKDAGREDGEDQRLVTCVTLSASAAATEPFTASSRLTAASSVSASAVRPIRRNARARYKWASGR